MQNWSEPGNIARWLSQLHLVTLPRMPLIKTASKLVQKILQIIWVMIYFRMNCIAFCVAQHWRQFWEEFHDDEVMTFVRLYAIRQSNKKAFISYVFLNIITTSSFSLLLKLPFKCVPIILRQKTVTIYNIQWLGILKNWRSLFDLII